MHCGTALQKMNELRLEIAGVELLTGQAVWFRHSPTMGPLQASSSDRSHSPFFDLCFHELVADLQS
jgi:hypothetical protein